MLLKYKQEHKIIIWSGDFNSAPCGLIYLYMHRHQVRLDVTDLHLVAAN